MRLQFVNRTERSVARTALVPLIAVVLTLLVTAAAVIGAGANPLSAFHRIFVTPLTRRSSILEVLVSATPLIFTGTAVAIAFRAGYYSIGAEGQLLAGAMASTFVGVRVGSWPGPLAVIAVIVAGAIGGMLWAVVPALLRVRFGTDEVVTTLLLNPVATLVVSGLLNGPWRNTVTKYPESDPIAGNAHLPRLLERSRLHLGFILAVIVAIVSGLAIWKPVQLQELTALMGGFEIARRVHFFAMVGLVVFLVVHVAYALTVKGVLAPMVTGRSEASQ